MKRINRRVIFSSFGLLIILVVIGSSTRTVMKASGQALEEANIDAPAPAFQPTVMAASSSVSLPAVSLPAVADSANAPAALEAGSVRVTDIDHAQQVYIPAGEFLMGSIDPEAKLTVEGGRAYPEIPQHTVFLEGFWIDKFEVTNRQYALCVAAGVCEPPFVNYSTGNPDYYGNPAFEDYPVIWVSWYKARAYCEWTGRRLPTEAEWEKAARGTQGFKYPWGDEPVSGEKANFCDKGCLHKFANPAFDDGYPDVAPVGSFPDGVSPYGAMDMAGNVSEWTSSLVRPYPYDANDGREELDDPGERVWRSSPWRNGFWWLRTSMRYRSVPTYQREVLGFRCAATD